MKKRYKRLTYVFKNSIEVYEYLDGRYGAPGEKREKKKKATKEEIAKRNQWNRERKVRHKLKTWFHENDYLVLLTYKKEERPPDMKTAKAQFKTWYEKLRKEFRKRGAELRWIRNIEKGLRGNWHVHVVINRIEGADILIKKAWPHGKVTFKHLYESGDFADLAGYICKTPETCFRYKESLSEASYSASKNLPVEEPKVKKLAYWRKEPKEKEGYYIDRDSFHEGTNPHTKCKYRYYKLVRIHRRI